MKTDISTFMTVRRSILLRIKNVSDKSCTANQNKHLKEFHPRCACRNCICWR